MSKNKSRRNRFALKIETFLLENGASFKALTSIEKEAVQQKWRETYSATLKQQTGEWTLGGFDWHTFSGAYSKSLDGDKAKEAYLKTKIIELKNYYVIPESKASNGYLCQFSRVVDFRPIGQDIHIFPKTLEWTMVFTHEDGWLGPYFSMREWFAK